MARELTDDLDAEFTEEIADGLVKKAMDQGYILARPTTPHRIRLLRQAIHRVVAARLIEARNRSRLNNDKINRKMLDYFLTRQRRGKAWTFTNAVKPSACYFPDEEEVHLLASITNADREYLGVHLRIAPWLLEDQNARREKRQRKTRARQAEPNRSLPRPQKTPSKTSQDGPSVTKMPEQDGPPENEGPPLRRRPILPSPPPSSLVEPPMAPPPGIPDYAGDVKISHVGNRMHVNGKVWCDQATAQKLRMIVPLKLLQQARHDDPWSYEINGPIHAYQLYNLFHVLYGTPRVLQVEQ